MAAHSHFPSKPMEPKSRCKEEWAKVPRNRCARLVAKYSQKREAVFVLCGAKAVDIDAHVISLGLNKAVTYQNVNGVVNFIDQ